MSATSVLFSGNMPEPFRHFPGVAAIYANDRYQQFLSMNPTQIKPGDINLEFPNVISFLSEKPKVFISLMNGPYHFLHDTLGPVLYMIEKMPEAQFIFDQRNMYFFDDAYLKHFFATLYKKNIDFKAIKFESGQIIVANNFYYQESSTDCFDAGNRLYNFFQDDIKNKDVEPFRKIYLSRRSMLDRDYTGIIEPGPSHMHDNRIINEPLLEEFLSSIGFEIVVPEEFENFSDQINYYYETKTVVSVTSSGLTPATAFMQPRSNVVELVNSMIVPIGRPDPNGGLAPAEEALHLFYIAIAFNRDHNYFAIPNKTRRAEDIIEKIKSSPSFRSVLME